MKPAAVAFLLALCVAWCSAFLQPRALPATGARAVGRARSSSSRGATVSMRVGGPKEDQARARQQRNRQLQSLEQDSERWFAEQERREANGELNILENPAFYTTLFVVTPIAILVWGFASGVIPGFVPVELEYTSVEEARSASYDDLISFVAATGSKLFA